MAAPLEAKPSTGAEALRRGAGALRAAGIEDPVLEAELLLRHVLGLDKSCFYLRLPDLLTATQERAYRHLLLQRLAHKPTAYITGHREFYDLDLHVAPGVLIPRPETEMIVERCLVEARQLLRRQRRVACVDVGTGSGAIALAVAKHLPEVEVLAVDRSREALAIAAYNARRLRLAGRVQFLEGDLLAPLHRPVDLVAANLPYIPSSTIASLAPEVKEYEPQSALDGDDDGLQQIGRLLAQLPGKVRAGGCAILEIGFDQGVAVREICISLGMPCVEICPDLAGHDRMVVVRL